MNFRKHFIFLGSSLLFGTCVFAQQYQIDKSRIKSRILNTSSIKNLQQSYNQDKESSIRVAEELMNMAKQKLSPTSNQSSRNGAINPFANMITNGTKIRVQIVAASAADITNLKKILSAKGMTAIVSYKNFINGDIAVNNIPSLEEITNIMMVKPEYKPKFNSGVVKSQADKAMRADIAREEFGVNGSGVKIGILSDSYNALGGAPEGVIKGELPGIGNPDGFNKPVVVLKDPSLSQIPNLNDEGRAMAEIIHDVAPGAEIYFYTATDGEVDVANGIKTLADAGCKVIVDDVAYLAEPFYQDGLISLAIEEVSNLGVTYFTSAGNSGTKSYEYNFKPFNFAAPGEAPLILQNFSSNPATPSDNLPFFCRPGASCALVLQWTQPFKSISGGTSGAKTDFDLAVFDIDGNRLALDEVDQIGGDPVSIVGFRNTSQSNVVFLTVLKRSGINTSKLKIRLFGGTFDVGLFNNLVDLPGLFASTVTGHSSARSAITVGAADYRKTKAFGAALDTIEGFSSKGGTPILFNSFGGRTFELRLKPEIVAADNANTSFFFRGSDADGDGIPNFSGTSASAPHAAAVAALCLEASNCTHLPPAYIKDAFISNTNDMDDPETPGFDDGFDFRTGYGFIRADDIVDDFDFCFNNQQGAKKNQRILNSGKNDSKDLLSFFPNPVKNELNISINDVKFLNSIVNLKVIDISGKQIPISFNKKANRININVSSLTPGTYVAQVVIDKQVKNLKFVKQ